MIMIFNTLTIEQMIMIFNKITVEPQTTDGIFLRANSGT